MRDALTYALQDRAAGVLLGSAVGDALGAGYEFELVASDLVPAMVGGGLGNFAPGEWTDDTAQAVAIARVAASGIDLRTKEALDQIAEGFIEWFDGHPPDGGNQTRAVLMRARTTPTGAALAAAAREVHETRGRSAGNGSLMRTGPIALAYLDDPVGLVEAAMEISGLTHHEDYAREACAVWTLLVRHAVLTGELPTFAEIEPWAPRVARWRDLIAEAESSDPGTFTNNTWAVGALQAAWSAIRHTPFREDDYEAHHFADGLTTSIRIGVDTDTVGSIAGALLGARWGMSAIPAQWRRVLHGWPDLTGKGLEKLAILTMHKGETVKYGWPVVDHIDYADLQYGKPARAVHPHDDGVWLTSATELDSLPTGVDVVVSLCLTGRTQVPGHVEHINFRFLDDPELEANPNLDFALLDAARTVATLRGEGKTVLVHCVASHSRTPAVGIAYSLLTGIPLDKAFADVCGVLPAANPNAGFRDALKRLAAKL